MTDLAWLLLVAVCVGLFAVVMTRPPPPPGGKPRGRASMGAACLLVLTLAATGCASPLNTAKLVVGGAADLYNTMEPRLEAAEKGELDACMAPPADPKASPACVEQVVTAWAPVKNALVALDGAIAAARLGLLVAAASDATGKPIDAAEVQRLVLAVIDAVTALQRAAAPRPSSPAPVAAPSATAEGAP